MANLLISFCNTYPRGFALGELDFDTLGFRWLDVSRGVADSVGVTGICRCRDAYWVLHQQPEGLVTLSRLDDELRPLRQIPLLQTKDAHSLVAHEDGFLVTDTGNNRLMFVRPHDDGTAEETVFWRWGDTGSDLAHLNSVVRLNGSVCVSLFGPKPPEGWQGTQDGRILDITRGTVVCEGLQHPHTLVSEGDDLYWLESRRGLLHRHSPQRGHEVVLDLGGYLRGLALDEQYFYVGASALRRRSRSTGTVNQWSAQNPDRWHCWLYRVHRQTLVVERHDLTPLGTEIFDLAILPPPRPPLPASTLAEAIVARLWKYEDELGDLQERHVQHVGATDRQLAAYRELDEAAQRQLAEAGQVNAQLRLEAGAAHEAKDRLAEELRLIRCSRVWKLRRRVLSAASHFINVSAMY